MGLLRETSETDSVSGRQMPKRAREIYYLQSVSGPTHTLWLREKLNSDSSIQRTIRVGLNRGVAEADKG